MNSAYGNFGHYGIVGAAMAAGKAGELLLQSAPELITAISGAVGSRQRAREATSASQQQAAYQLAAQERTQRLQILADVRKQQYITWGAAILGGIALFAIMSRQRPRRAA